MYDIPYFSLIYTQNMYKTSFKIDVKIIPFKGLFTPVNE